jgi:hypothetical protein
LLFIHIKLGIIRSGFKVKRGEDKWHLKKEN